MPPTYRLEARVKTLEQQYHRLTSVVLALARGERSVQMAVTIDQAELDELGQDVNALGDAIAQEHTDVMDAFGRLEAEINGGNNPTTIRPLLDQIKSGLDNIKALSDAAKGEGQPSTTGTTDTGSTGGTTDTGTGSTDTGTGDTQPTP